MLAQASRVRLQVSRPVRPGHRGQLAGLYGSVVFPSILPCRRRIKPCGTELYHLCRVLQVAGDGMFAVSRAKSGGQRSSPAIDARIIPSNRRAGRISDRSGAFA